MLRLRHATRTHHLLVISRGMRNKATPSAAKAKADRERDATARRYVQRIRVAHRDGDDARVQLLVKDATKAGVSKAVVDRAVSRMRNRGALEDVLYEGTLPGGICVLVEALTDKKTRTAPEVRHALSDGGGALGSPGAALWAFQRKGLLEFEPSDSAEREALLELALGLDGVDDLEEVAEARASADAAAPGGGTVRVWADVSEVATLRAALAAAHPLVNEQLLYVPLSTLALDDAEMRESHDATVDALRALDDVEAVWTNAEAVEPDAGG